MIDQEILACFLDEAVDSLAQWERAVLDLETDPKPETYNTLFRAAHNLKGASRAVGLEAFGGFVHCVEDLITILMKGHLKLNSALVGVLLQCQVELSKWIEELRQNPNAHPSVDQIMKKISAVTQLSLDELNFIAESLSEAPTVTVVEVEEPAAMAQEPQQSPAEEKGKPAVSETPIDELDALFAQAQKEYQATSAPSAASTAAPAAAPKVETPKVEPKVEQKAEKAPGADKAADSKAQKPDETIRISANKLDELLQLIGELSIHQAIVFQGKKSGTLDSRICQNAIHLSQKIVKDLYGKALSLRMQPVQALFQRLERVARDVARAQNKKIQVVLEGTDVELDKTVIERITDPLVHILRNAVDHGLEGPEDRLKAGKPDAARVVISATQDAAGACLRVTDDGRGLNRERIVQKAIERGLVAPNQTLTVNQIHNLIFLPSFSTAEKVTDISGRGVGMDVVMKAVQALQGSIDLTSEPGKGTSFAITLPTSLSIVDALVIKIADVRYAVAMHELTEIIDLSGYSIDTSGSRGRMFSLRGDVVPIQSLNDYLKAPVVKRSSNAPTSESRTHPALVVREGEEIVAFEVDSILGQQQVVVRPLSEHLAKIPGFNGSMILGDGEPGMIVSLTEITRAYLKNFSTSEKGV